ncbi:hypothetical protein M5X17_17450 [Paenibacillus alvei]|uniref:Uncharacterized protein n=1 Tax=Paenibacillus alvei TaxID=44250 RepID=A0ABT4GRR8_PAEAL|nr:MULTISPECIES: hypothetical protein [Paenibacillus]MBG9735218.1 hypothetical protein [Paenibacillus alvei]MBG9743676.1 hypothetical protein [Paenibacillus alvei]MCY7484201.1 hypothetical protein [Paenibacillus alvei]MCY9539760.1 hypothetical protein [Paenibacillus alvei]MCY9580094.1 hypothetical protein [Paenibacillus alvei]
MWASIGCVIIASAIFLFQSPRMKQRQLVKERWVLLTMLIIAAGFGVVVGMNWKIPNPMDLLMLIFKPMRKFL